MPSMWGFCICALLLSFSAREIDALVPFELQIDISSDFNVTAYSSPCSNTSGVFWDISGRIHAVFRSQSQWKTSITTGLSSDCGFDVAYSSISGVVTLLVCNEEEVNIFHYSEERIEEEIKTTALDVSTCSVSARATPCRVVHVFQGSKDWIPAVYGGQQFSIASDGVSRITTCGTYRDKSTVGTSVLIICSSQRLFGPVDGFAKKGTLRGYESGLVHQYEGKWVFYFSMSGGIILKSDLRLRDNYMGDPSIFLTPKVNTEAVFIDRWDRFQGAGLDDGTGRTGYCGVGRRYEVLYTSLYDADSTEAKKATLSGYRSEITSLKEHNSFYGCLMKPDWLYSTLLVVLADTGFDIYTLEVNTTNTVLEFFCPLQGNPVTKERFDLALGMVREVNVVVYDLSVLNYPLHLDKNSLRIEGGVLVLRNSLEIRHGFTMDTGAVIEFDGGSLTTPETAALNGTIAILSVSKESYDTDEGVYTLMSFVSHTGSFKRVEGCGELIYGDTSLTLDRKDCSADTSSSGERVTDDFWHGVMVAVLIGIAFT